MATTDKNNAPQQTDILKFVIVRPPELITIENQNKHYISPAIGVINKAMLDDFSDAFVILSKSKPFIFDLYRQLNKNRLEHEKIEDVSQLLTTEFGTLKNLFNETRTKLKEKKEREIEEKNNDPQTNFSIYSNLQQEIYFLKIDLENIGKVNFIDFLFLNLSQSYKQNFDSHQRQVNNLEIDLALIKCFHFLTILESLNITDFKKIEQKDVKALHHALNVSPTLHNIHVILEKKDKPVNQNNIVHNIGKADLKVVKQKLIRYQTGEIAHIENVLKGESKERKHRQLDRTENILQLQQKQ